MGQSAVLRWINRLSLDAVFVAVVWQWVFTVGFCERAPQAVESIALAGTVWLIYVADRLLDALRLDLNQPHTPRHRFYRDWSRTFAAAWIAVLLCMAALVAWRLNAAVVRAGLLLAAVVLAYGVAVHVVFRSAGDAARATVGELAGGRAWPLLVSKEPAVGGLFAAGIGLIAWTEAPGVPLTVATMMTACLFTMNCVLVATGETVEDGGQGFLSWAVRWPTTVTPLSIAVLTLCPVALAMGWRGWLPAVVAGSLGVATAAMLLPMLRSLLRRGSGTRIRGPISGGAYWWDTSLWVVPALVFLWLI